MPHPVAKSAKPIAAAFVTMLVCLGELAKSASAQLIPTVSTWVKGNGNWITDDIDDLDNWVHLPPPVLLGDFFLYPDNNGSRLFSVFTSFDGNGSRLRLKTQFPLTPVSVQNLNVMPTDTLVVEDSLLAIEALGLLTNEGLITLDNSQLMTTPLLPGVLPIAGNGQVQMQGSDSILGSVFGAVVLENQFVHGRGLITGTSLTLDSDILANVPGTTLNVTFFDGSSKKTLRAVNSAKLEVKGIIASAGFESDGLIEADGGIVELREMEFENNDVVRARNSGIVNLKDITVDNAGHEFDIQTGTLMNLRGGTFITGGLLRTTGSGQIIANEGVNDFIGTMTLIGNFQVHGTRLNLRNGNFNTTDANVSVGTLAEVYNSTLNGGTFSGGGLIHIRTPSVLNGTPNLTLNGVNALLPGTTTLTKRGTIFMHNGSVFTIQDQTAGLGSSDAILAIDGAVTIGGSGGFIRFGSNPISGHRNTINPINNGHLTLGENITIDGPVGTVGYITTPILNQGTIHAAGGTIYVEPTDITSTGQLAASGGGGLYLAKGLTLQNVGGRLTGGAGGTVYLNGSGAGNAQTLIIGGTLDGAGTIQSSGTTTLDGLTSPITTQDVRIFCPGSTILNLKGLINHGATFFLDDNSLGFGTFDSILRADGPVTLNGSGQIVFAPNTHQNNHNTIDAVNGGSFVFGPDLTVTTEVGKNGYGQVVANVTNHGVIQSHGGHLWLINESTVNRGTVQAVANGQLQIGRTQQPTLFDNTDAVIHAGPGSSVRFGDTYGGIIGVTTVKGGEFTGAGEFRIGPIVNFDAVNQPITLQEGKLNISASTTLNLQGEIALDNGRIELSDGNFATGTPARLRAMNHSTISGEGEIRFIPAQGIENLLDTPGGSFMFGPQISIRTATNGAGFLQGSMTSHGVIEANAGNIYLEANITNTGTIKSLNGGSMQISRAASAGNPQLVDNSGGTIQSGAGSTVHFATGNYFGGPAAVVLRGGELSGPGEFIIGPWIIWQGFGEPLLLRDTTVRVPQQARLWIEGAVAMDGSKIVLRDGNFALGTPTRLSASGQASLLGEGEVIFDLGPGFENHIDTAAGGSFTFGEGVTILVNTNCGGVVQGTITNHGTIHARGGDVTVEADVFNFGRIEATDGGRISLRRAGGSSTITGIGGVIHCDSSSLVRLGGLDGGVATAGLVLDGGELVGPGEFEAGIYVYTISVGSRLMTLRDATLRVVRNSQFYIHGMLVLDKGLIRFYDSQFGGNSPRFRIPAHTTITGEGEILFDTGPGASSTIDTPANGSLTLGENITLRAAPVGTGNLVGHFKANGNVHVDGTLALASGSFAIESTGSLTGAGNLFVPGGVALINHGTIAPGNETNTARFTVNGLAANSAGGKLLIKIAGPTAITNYSVLRVTSQFSAAGRLHVEFPTDYRPAPGDTFTVVTAGSIIGSFANVSGGKLVSGLHSFDVTQTATSITLANYAPLPDPYDAWINSFASVTDPDARLKTADADNDGLPNVLEFILGTDAGNADAANVVILAPQGDTLVVTFRQRKEAVSAGYTVLVQYTPSLGSTNWSTASPGMMQTSDAGEFELVTVTIPVPPGASEMFVRLGVAPEP